VSVVKNILLGDNPYRVASRISKRNLKHLEIRNGDFIGTEGEIHERDIFKRIRPRDVCLLIRHLATLLRAGLSLLPALYVLVEQLEGNTLAKIMKQVAGDVKAGSTFSDSLKKHPDVFSSLIVNMVAAGQANGNLDEALLRLAEMLEKRIHLAGKVKSAIAYPLMMLIVAAGVVIFLLSFVVPSITQIFLEMNRGLPWPTRLLISTSSFLKTYLVFIAIVICGVFFGIQTWQRTKQGRLFVDRSKLKLPFFGNLFVKLEIARLTRTLGVLIASGIPILSALEITKGVIQNSFIARALDSVKELVSRGDNIADALKKTGLFPPIVFHIISVGQISGEMETGFLSIADMYDDEIERQTKTLISLLEPAILLAMGVVVGFIVLAILLPIFEINQTI